VRFGIFINLHVAKNLKGSLFSVWGKTVNFVRKHLSRSLLESLNQVRLKLQWFLFFWLKTILRKQG